MTVTTLHLTARGLRLAISSRSPVQRLEDLAGRSGHMMISIKNTSFSARLVNAYCAFAVAHLAHGYVTLVDKPYIHNVAATYTDAAQRDSKLKGMAKLCRERTRQLEKIVGKYPQNRLSILPWDDLIDAVPTWLTDEITNAFHRKGAFRAALSAQCRQAVTNYDTITDPERLEHFLLEETPVLLYAYYLLDGGVVDFYPGDVPQFFLDIEQGRFEEDLPQTTTLARRHPGVVYAVVYPAWI